MRLITGAIKSTPIVWLPVLSAIAPLSLRREEATQNSLKRIREEDQLNPLKPVLQQAPATSRLKSRKPFYKAERETFNIKSAWREEWGNNTLRGGHLIHGPTKPLKPDRLRSGHGRTAANMHRWGLRESTHMSSLP